MKKKEVMVMSPDASHKYRDVPIVPDTEVTEKATRRRFTAEYKRHILKQADACREQKQVGALLRREGLYYSNLATWRRQAKQGTLDVPLHLKKEAPEQKSLISPPVS